MEAGRVLHRHIGKFRIGFSDGRIGGLLGKPRSTASRMLAASSTGLTIASDCMFAEELPLGAVRRVPNE
jgi:hypothetical protein